MARGEIHLPLFVSYAEDDKLADVSRGARLLYIDACCLSKRTLLNGILTAGQVERLCYPDTPTKARKQIKELVDSGALVLREDGRYEIPGFLKRNPSREQVERRSEERAQFGRRGGQRSGEVRRSEANGKQRASTLLPSGLAVASTLSNTETETETEKNIAPAAPTPLRPREPDPIWDSLLTVCGLHPAEITTAQRGALNKAVGDLRKVAADPAEIPARAAQYRRHWPDSRLTPTALAKQWAACAAPTRGGVEWA